LQQQQQAKQKQMAAALARSQSGGSQQGQTLPPAQVLMGQGGELPAGTHPGIRLAQQQLVQQQRLQQQYRTQQLQQQQNKPQGLAGSASSGQLQTPPPSQGANKPPTKQQAAQLKRQLSQQQSGSQSEQSQQMFQRQASQNEVQSANQMAQMQQQQRQSAPQGGPAQQQVGYCALLYSVPYSLCLVRTSRWLGFIESVQFGVFTLFVEWTWFAESYADPRHR
jgi:hypothetical protein